MPSAPSRPVPLAHVPALDGLRGVAVVGVLAFHAGFARASGGFLGVSTFFTLSGFLVASILLRSATMDRRTVTAFWGRRLRRLVPASFAAVALGCVVGRALQIPATSHALRWDALSAAGFWSNWRFLLADRSYGDLFATPSPFDHYWSLAIEAQLYLLMPLILTAVVVGLPVTRRRTRAAPRGAGPLGVVAVAIVVGSTALCVLSFSPGVDNSRIYYGTATRAGEFFVGVALAALLAPRGERTRHRGGGTSLGLGGLTALAGLVVLCATASLSEPWVYRGGFTLNAVLSGVVIAASVAGAPFVTTVLGARPLTELGRISYGVYVYHWPVFLVLTEARLGWGRWPTLALRLSATLALAIVSYRWLESPLRRRRPIAAPLRRSVVPVAAVATVVAVVLLATSTTWGGTVGAQDPAGPMVVRGPAQPAHSAAPAPLDPSGDGLRVAVVGDADGVQLGRDLADWARGDGRFEVGEPRGWGCETPPCASWATRWVDLVRREHADVLVLSVNHFDGAAAAWGVGDGQVAPEPSAGLTDWLTGHLRDAVDAVTATGAVVVWLPVVDRSGSDLATRAEPHNGALFAALDAITSSSENVRRLGVETQYNDHIRSAGVPDDHIALVAELAGPRLAAIAQSVVPGVPRVMLVGDSVARSLGAGLETWGAAHGVSVWDVSRDGCGILVDGDVQGLYAGLGPLPSDCAATAQRWASQFADFRPRTVIVLSTIWDLADRRLAQWPRPLHPGDVAFDDYMLDRYQRFVTAAVQAGASVTWLTVPCSDPTHGGLPFGTPRTRTAFAASRRTHVNDVVLARLAAANPSTVRVEPFGDAVCPGGRFTERLGPVASARPDGLHFSEDGARWLADQHGWDWVGGG